MALLVFASAQEVGKNPGKRPLFEWRSMTFFLETASARCLHCHGFSHLLDEAAILVSGGARQVVCQGRSGSCPARVSKRRGLPAGASRIACQAVRLVGCGSDAAGVTIFR